MDARFTRAAAKRHADLAHERDATQAEVRGWIDDWFAAVYGWPLSHGEAADRDEFLSLVDEQMKATP